MQKGISPREETAEDCALCDSAGRCTYACDYDRIADTARAMGLEVPADPRPVTRAEFTALQAEVAELKARDGGRG